jgi:hypothetical protein
MLIWLISLTCLVWIILGFTESNAFVDDFIEYWAAGGTFLGGGNPYSASELYELQKGYGLSRENVLMMWNPPWTLPALLPFAVLPYGLARVVWLLVHLSVMFACVDWLWRTYGGSPEHRWFARASILWYYPSFLALTIGQISPFILGGLVAFLWAERRGRDVGAGLCTLSIAFKPQLIYTFWLFLVLSSWKGSKLRGLISAAGVLATFSVLVWAIRPSIFHEYFLATSSETGPWIWRTPTWSAVLFNWFYELGLWVRYSTLVPGVILALLIWFRRRTTFNWTKHLNSVLLLACLTTPFAWSFDMVVLMPVIVAILIWYKKNPSKNRKYFIALVAVQVCLFLQKGLMIEEIYTVWMPATIALIYWFSYRTNREESPIVISS